MGGYFQHIDKMDGSEIMGTLFIPLPFHCDDSILSDHVYKIAGSASLSFVAAAGFAGAYLAYEIIRRIPVLRWIVCGIGGKKNNVCRKSHSASKTKSYVAG